MIYLQVLARNQLLNFLIIEIPRFQISLMLDLIKVIVTIKVLIAQIGQRQKIMQ